MKIEYSFSTEALERKVEKVIYVALRFTKLGIPVPRIPISIKPKHAKVFADHVTLRYFDNNEGPDYRMPDFIGKTTKVNLVERCVDDKGDAIVVSINDSTIRNYASKTQQHTHVTISCADGTSPVYSNSLITSASERIKMTGTVTCKVMAFVKFEDGSTGWIAHK